VRLTVRAFHDVFGQAHKCGARPVRFGGEKALATVSAMDSGELASALNFVRGLNADTA
jgi:hypothetical protein